MTVDGRLLTVLGAMNEIGICTVLDLHRATRISRPAVHRIVESLCGLGFVERVPATSRFRLTSAVLRLSAGYRNENWIVETAVPMMNELQRLLRWPSSLATPLQGQMIVRETTRHRSPFVFDQGGVGFRLPMLASSLGLAYLAFENESTRAATLELLASSPERWDRIARDAAAARRLVKQTVARGFAFRKGGHTPLTSSIAVPIRTNDRAVGAICVTVLTSAVPYAKIIEELLPPLRDAAAKIALSPHLDRGSGD